MAYDNKTYGTSPFGKAIATTARTASLKSRRDSKAEDTDAEALSDQLSESQTAAEGAQDEAPVLPPDYASAIKPRTAFLHIPKGRVTGLNMLGEALGWLMAWGTVGFFRAYVPAPVLTIFDRLFTPWGMASLTFASALLIGQMLKRHQLKLDHLRQLATTAIEYGETHHRADTQTHIDELLSAAVAQTEQASRWLVSWLTALGALFIIGAFY